MRTARFGLAAVVALVLVALAAGAAAQGRDLHTVEFFSPAVDRTARYNILLPSDYETSTARYPVLYLLHGLTQNYTAWGRSNGAPFYGGLYDDLIVVMPDVGNSWYVNWAESENGQRNNWEDHVIQDVVSHVDWTFRDDRPSRGACDDRAVDGWLRRDHHGVAASGDVHLDWEHEWRARVRPSGRRRGCVARCLPGRRVSGPLSRRSAVVVPTP